MTSRARTCCERRSRAPAAGCPRPSRGCPCRPEPASRAAPSCCRSAGLALAVYGAGRTLTPDALQAAVAEAAGEQRVLVSIFMDGGADALSLLAPTGDPRYALLRPQLALAPDPAWALEADSRLRWHPSALGLKQLWDDPGVGIAVAPAIGYDSPNQSHFTSRHFWEVGPTNPLAATGWLGRYLDRVGDANVPIHGLSLEGTLSPTLATESVAVAAATDLSDYRFRTSGVWGAVETRMRSTAGTLGALAAADPITAQARQAQSNATALARDLASVGNGAGPGDPGYPDAASSFRTRLQAIARLLGTTDGANSLPVRCVTLNAAGGYDTHSNQADSFTSNLLTTASNVRAFWRDLELRGLADRVVIKLWSEFGRRPAQNGSMGTDHGAAGAAFVIGRNVRQGLIGEFPGLGTGAGGGLDAHGNLRATADFRGLYSSLLEQWFQTEAAGIIPSAGSFARRCSAERMRRLAALVLAVAVAVTLAGALGARPAEASGLWSSSRAGVTAKRVPAGRCAKQRAMAAKRTRAQRRARACSSPRRLRPVGDVARGRGAAPPPPAAKPGSPPPHAAIAAPAATAPVPELSAPIGAGADSAPAAPVASTLGVDAYDFGSFVLRLSRAWVPAGSLTIYFRNNDVSDHNLWLDPPAPATRSELISDAVGEDGGASKVGAWRLYCSLLGHGAMSRTLTVG